MKGEPKTDEQRAELAQVKELLRQHMPGLKITEASYGGPHIDSAYRLEPVDIELEVMPCNDFYLKRWKDGSWELSPRRGLKGSSGRSPETVLKSFESMMCALSREALWLCGMYCSELREHAQPEPED